MPFTVDCSDVAVDPSPPPLSPLSSRPPPAPQRVEEPVTEPEPTSSPLPGPVPERSEPVPEPGDEDSWEAHNATHLGWTMLALLLAII